MNTYLRKSPEKNGKPVGRAAFQTQNSSPFTFQLADHRPEHAALRRFQAMADRSTQTKQIAQMQAIADQYTRPQSHAISQGAFQMRAAKTIEGHARDHYEDGWGAAYGITADDQLRASVPDAVTGAGSINLGEHDAPDDEQDTEGRIKSKMCSIGYEDRL